MGWTFFYMDQIKASVFGFDREKTARRALNRVLANARRDKFNSLEITHVAAKSSSGSLCDYPRPPATYSGKYVSVGRQTPGGTEPSQIACRLDWEGRDRAERNGDKARFGQERKKKNLQRKRNRELRTLLAPENKATPISAESGREHTLS